MRKPAVSTKRAVLASVSAALALVCALVLAIPTTRDGLFQAWCSLSDGAGCAGGPVSPGRDLDENDWRLPLPPLQAATWGNYFALGDSYSSGDGADDYLPGTAVADGCWRSANAYPEKIADTYDFAGDLAFLACSGQRGNAMLESLGTTDSQLDRVTAHASLVTIGIGGNDLGFTSVLKTCMLRVPLLDSGACIGQEEEIDRRMGAFEETFEELIGEVRDRAPDARVVVLGYPRLFPTEPTGMYYTLTSSDQVWLNETVERFNDQIRAAVDITDTEIAEAGQTGSVEFVDVYDALAGHEVGSEDPWVNGVLLRDLTEGLKIDRSTFHPNAAGQEAVGERVRERIEAGPGRTLYVSRATVENASPDVLASEVR
ncbi:SGNH/GDSL hydrolase family protein [Marinactinospora thermotolerans]|uniref:SGNH/GDSL hydrolase family protein n=1 Tax=Marinactinospora thermotolerans TaxID=531310 RepID=UPI003D91CB0A